ncbi:MAG: hypothetical protein ACH349_04600 [Candidatus Rhabdochlamydia sp.]|jgi:hypothetical protein
MIFEIIFFNMPGKPLLTKSSSFPGITRRAHEYTTKVNDFAGGFFSRLSSKLGFGSFSFRIPKNLIDQFQRSADFYKRFPQLRPTFNEIGSIYNIKLLNPIVRF